MRFNTRMLLGGFALLLILANTVQATESSTPDSPNAATPNNGAKLESIPPPELSADPVVCKRLAKTGSRVKQKKCMRKSAWDRARRVAQEGMDDTVRRSNQGS